MRNKNWSSFLAARTIEPTVNERLCVMPSKKDVQIVVECHVTYDGVADMYILSNNDETESWLIFRTTLTRFILTIRHGLKRFQNRQVFDIRKIKDVVIEKIGTLLFSELQKYFPFEDLRIMFKILTISLENLQLLEPISRTGL